MLWFWDVIGAFFITVGLIFSFLGVLGTLRLEETYSRLHASGKTSTLGNLFLCLGVGILLPSSGLKLLLLGIFIIFAGPVGSHAIGAAVRRNNLRSQDQPEPGIAE